MFTGSNAAWGLCRVRVDLGWGKELPFFLFVPENTLTDRVNVMRSLVVTFARLMRRVKAETYNRIA